MYHVRVSGRDAYGNGPTVGDEQQFKTMSVAGNPPGFDLTAESFPRLLVVVVLAVALTLGMYAAGKRIAKGTRPAPRAPDAEPHGDVTPPLQPELAPLPSIPAPSEGEPLPGGGPAKMMLEDNVHAGEPEDGSETDKTVGQQAARRKVRRVRTIRRR
jgi:hypothetical protein